MLQADPKEIFFQQLRNENVNLKSSIAKQNKYIATLEDKLIDNGLAVRKPKDEIKVQKNKSKTCDLER